MHSLRYRQVHLDFHTSPVIEDIGTAFDKKQWQDMLQQGHVNSITCFAVGHHGWHYHDTQLGKRHPHLNFDLLRAQYEASKEIDVNVPIYLTAGVSSRVAEEHPEWREILYDGQLGGNCAAPTEPGFASLCFNTPYLDYLCATIRETVTLFPECNGIFLDIITQAPCCCTWCMQVMREAGLDPLHEADRNTCAKMALMRYYEQSTAAVRDIDPDMPIFHNSGHITRGNRDILPYFSHLELESLPTGGWGYDHFPLSAKYCHNLPLDFLGMTGKFQTTWGEFGGYKHPNALRYECAAMLAFGAKCSVGDQLHPAGAMDPSTYAIIGAAYAEVEKKEPWCIDAKNIADIAILSSDAIAGDRGIENQSVADVGACRMLLEGQYLFDVIDAEMEFTRYACLILPDDVEVSDSLKKKLDAYLAQGGKLLMTGKSGIGEEGFLFEVGATREGESPYQPDYALPADPVCPDFVTMPMAMYFAPQRIKVVQGESLGEVYDPWFNRTHEHFCSHQHAPAHNEASGYQAGVLHKNIAYLAHPVFSGYYTHGTVSLKQYVLKTLDLLLGDTKSLRTNLPSTARVSLTHQPEQKRYILHLLYANTIQRGGKMTLQSGDTEINTSPIEVIEELLPLRDFGVTLELPTPIQDVRLEPQGKTIPFECIGNTAHIHIETFTCHQMFVLEYKVGL